MTRPLIGAAPQTGRGQRGETLVEGGFDGRLPGGFFGVAARGGRYDFQSIDEAPRGRRGDEASIGRFDGVGTHTT